jgi:hypothetical protein
MSGARGMLAVTTFLKLPCFRDEVQTLTPFRVCFLSAGGGVRPENRRPKAERRPNAEMGLFERRVW